MLQRHDLRNLLVQGGGSEAAPITWRALDFLFTLPLHELSSGHLRAALSGLECSDGFGPVETLHGPAQSSPGLPEQIGDLVSQITMRAILSASGSLLFHAGGLAREDGEVVVLTGPSGSGKSTLTVHLAAEGLHYLTDETVCMDPVTLRVRPFRKPVSLKSGSHPLMMSRLPAPPIEGRTWLVPPSAIGSAPAPSRPLTPGLLLFPTYDPGVTMQVDRLTPGEAAYLLGVNSAQLAQVQPSPLSALGRLVRRAPAYRIVHNDAAAAAKAVRELWAA